MIKCTDKKSPTIKFLYYRLPILIIIIGCLQSSCEKPDISDDPNLLNYLYSNSTDTIEIKSNKYFLETYLYRNFMPGAFRERGLVAIGFLVRADSSTIPSDLNLSKLNVVQNQLIWISIPINSTDPYIPDFKHSKVSIKGPEWDTEIDVDVVAEISDNVSKEKYLLIARKQKIERAD